VKQLEPGSLADRMHALMCAHHDEEGYTEGELARQFDTPMHGVRVTLEEFAIDGYFKRDVNSRRWMAGDLVIDRAAGPLVVPASPWQSPLPAGEAVGFDELPRTYRPDSKAKRIGAQIDAQLVAPGLCLEGLAMSDHEATKRIVSQRHRETSERYAIRKASATTFNLYRLPNAQAASTATVHQIKRVA
jgi:hypothetical protein